MTSKLNAKYKDNNNTTNTTASNNRNSRKSNLNHKNTSFLKSSTPHSSNNSKFTTKLNDTQTTTTTKYNRVVLNSFRLPDSSEYDDENTEEADTSASIHFNSDFASFSSNEYNSNNNHISENSSPRKENYTADNNSRNTTRRRVSCPVSTHGNCSNNHQHNYYHQVDDFRFLKFDPFDRVVSRLSGRKKWIILALIIF